MPEEGLPPQTYEEQLDARLAPWPGDHRTSNKVDRESLRDVLVEHKEEMARHAAVRRDKQRELETAHKAMCDAQVKLEAKVEQLEERLHALASACTAPPLRDERVPQIIDQVGQLGEAVLQLKEAVKPLQGSTISVDAALQGNEDNRRRVEALERGRGWTLDELERLKELMR